MVDFINFLLGLGLIFLIGFSISMYDHINKLKNIKNNIIRKYGKKIDIKDVNLKMHSISSYFENKNNKQGIDDITWNDLNMDDVFKSINNTQSTAGREVLYDILRNPLHNEDKLSKRDKIIEYFKANEKERKEIQYDLGKLGESDDLYTSNCLFNGEDLSKSQLLKYALLSWLPILSVVLMFFNGYFVILLISSIVFNMYLSQADKKKNYNTDGFTYIISTVKTANKIKKLGIEVIDENLDNIDENLNNVKNIKGKYINKGTNTVMTDANIFSEYTKMAFLSDLKTYEKVKNTVIKKSEDLRAIYEFIGMIDALIAVASFRDSLDYYTKPSLSKSNNKDENNLEFIDIYHPLIKEPVENSATFSKCVLFTGSNASGKSTFIKTIAINAILAQTIYTCLAKEYKSSYFNIYTSMALKDDIFSSESYYIVEIKSLKRIIDSINEEIPSLCFVDEILRGTNTVERISSSAEVLSYLGKSNCLCFSATHDIELTYILEDKFENYHFEETITDKDIKFDYKLHRGRAQTRNAIKLLEFMGYDEQIVNNSENRAEKFMKTGKW